MENSKFKLYYIWKPLSLIYEIGVRVRNLFFTWHLLPSKQYPLPVICVGNLAVGGTGKTPLIEYLIRLLGSKYRVAVLSRGYKRKSSGFVLAKERSTAVDIGDEPYQIKLKYPDVVVAVDKDRRRGVRKLLALPDEERPQVVLLDDAFQHRYIQASLSIIVTDYNRLYYKDKLMPVGRLREPAGSIRRADMVVVSKTDPSLRPIDCRIVENEMKLSIYQPLFFTSITYQRMEGVFPKDSYPRALSSLKKDEEVLLLTGIANPTLLIKEVKKYSDHVKVMSFPDHHLFTRKDVKKIRAERLRMQTDHPLIICTEKDAVRIRNSIYFPEEWRSSFYYVPIMVNFLFDKSALFDEFVLKHVSTIVNSSILRQ